MKILLIEDEKPLSDALCQIFSKKRWETFAAYNGETGLDEALTGIYDVILLDIMLPKAGRLRRSCSALRSEASSTTPVHPAHRAKGEVTDKVGGAGLRRGRLPGQAVCHRGAAGAHPRHDPPPGGIDL